MIERITDLENVIKEKSSAESKMQNAVEKFENVVKAMTRKVLYLEEEVKNMKENSKKVEEDFKNIKDNSNKVEGKEPFKDTHEFKNSTPVSAKKTPSVVDEKSCVLKKDQFKCKNCDYKCKREGNLQKHMKSKHEEHQCKECKEKFSSSIDLLKHVSKHNFKDEGDKKLNAKKYEILDNMLLTDFEDNKKDEKD